MFSFLDIKIIWLPENLRTFKDNRRGLRKDFTDTKLHLLDLKHQRFPVSLDKIKPVQDKLSKIEKAILLNQNNGFNITLSQIIISILIHA